MSIFRKIKKRLLILRDRDNLVENFKNTIINLEIRKISEIVREIQKDIRDIIFLKERKKHIIRLIQEVKKSKNMEKIIEFVLFNKKTFVKPTQIKSEIKALIEFLQEKNLKYILEIGTYMGSTLFLFSQIVAKDSIIISVDLPGGSYGRGYPKWRIPIYKSFPLLRNKLFLIRKDSHKLSTLNKVQKILKHNKLDFLFIDGDHTYSGVRKDFVFYSQLVKENGIIAFHDIVIHPPESNCHVNKMWCEIKDKYKSVEFVEDWNQKGGGIGVIEFEHSI
jgi:predicted O-methyltransferase YrrM